MARKKKRRIRGQSTSKRRKSTKKIALKSRVKRRKPTKKFISKSRAKKRGKATRRELQDRVERQEKIIKELADESRLRRKLRFVEGEEEEEEIEEGPLSIPGEVPVRNREGELLGYSLPETQEDFDDADFGDWDFFYDEIEDYLEEEDHEGDTGRPAK